MLSKLQLLLSNVLLLVGVFFMVQVDANLSSLCCGDNFCCAILATTSEATCWGGGSMSKKIPTSSTVKALTCGGKALMGIDSNMQISYYVGTDGYGPDHPSATSLIGVTVKDAELSFWGGAILKSDGTITAWGPDTVYCGSASSISCQPAVTDTAATAVTFAFKDVPSGTTSFTGLNCGGKRGGHWCCAYQTGVTDLTCFGDSRGEYTPSSTELNKLDFAVYQISTGVDFIAVLGTSGQLGVYGGQNEIGNGLTNTNPSSLADLSMGSVVANEVYVQVSTMNFAIYALKSDGTVHAWGKSFDYSVGGGGSADMAALVPSGVTFGQLYGGSAGVYAHYCALKSDGVPVCWGADYSGQVSGSPTSAVSTAFSMPSLLGITTTTTTTTTTVKTTTTSTTTTAQITDTISTDVTLTALDYDAMVQDEDAMASLTTDITETYSSYVSSSCSSCRRRRRVSVSYRKGSVIANVTIAVEAGDDSANMTETLVQAKSGTESSILGKVKGGRAKNFLEAGKTVNDIKASSTTPKRGGGGKGVGGGAGGDGGQSKQSTVNATSTDAENTDAAFHPIPLFIGTFGVIDFIIVTIMNS